MSGTHELKTWSPEFRAVWDGTKTFEIRPAHDREFKVGDLLLLREFIPCGVCRGAGTIRSDSLMGERITCYKCSGRKGRYTGYELTAEIAYLMEGGRFGLADGHVAMSIELKQKASASGRYPAAGA